MHSVSLSSRATTSSHQIEERRCAGEVHGQADLTAQEAEGLDLGNVRGGSLTVNRVLIASGGGRSSSGGDGSWSSLSAASEIPAHAKAETRSEKSGASGSRRDSLRSPRRRRSSSAASGESHVLSSNARRSGDDEENEEEGGLSKSGKELKKLLGRAAGLNDSDADEDEEEDDQEDESSPVLAPKQKDHVKDEPVDNSPAKPTPSGHARSTPPASKSKQKRKSVADDAKTSGSASKKAKVEPDTKASIVKEEASSSAKPTSKASASSKSGANVSPVTEDEIRSVLLAVAPDKNAFAEILKKISKIQKTNGHNYVVLREDKK
ncbi:hypothetical protein PR202_gb07739 [Eleusine coracana subsp. coracana]|uniref:Transcription initiation factor IIF subunit alpha n=1 Tax=Eleusine coracana subsp. coracana TaxID=191504 RepID=A0AAV5EAH7_ELECO|nr:hypothetical protein PR202_gb07739 [Eleusine coracana subsp. coracana]